MKRELSYALLAVFGVAGAMYFVAAPVKKRRDTQDCQRNLKQIGLAMMQYVRDYDEHFAPADKWQTVIEPYYRHDTRRRVLDCPAPGGYAMNARLSDVQLGLITDSINTPLIWDANTSARNARDDGRLWPLSPRHETSQARGNNVLFSDGHVKLLKAPPNFAFVPGPTPTPWPTPTVAPRRRTR